MLDLVNIGLRTLMCLVFLVWVIRPLLFVLTRREPNQGQIEEVAELAVLSAFRAQNLPDAPTQRLLPQPSVSLTHAAESEPAPEAPPDDNNPSQDLSPPDAAQAQPVQLEQKDAAAQEVEPGEALSLMLERIKKEQKKPLAIPPELLQAGNSHEDKLVLVRLLVEQQQNRVAGVIRQMIQK